MKCKVPSPIALAFRFVLMYIKNKLGMFDAVLSPNELLRFSLNTIGSKKFRIISMRRKEAGEVVSVIPVLMRHTANWQGTPVGALEPLPADRKPVDGRADRERVMYSIAERIRDIADEIRQGF